MNEQPSKEKGQKEGRSPGWPRISLGSALERAKILLEKGKRQYVPVSVVYGYWGYGDKSSMGNLILATLKKFGLIEDRGSLDSREAKISDLAWEILIDERQDSKERLALIREAALNPAIHRKLWNDFEGHLPADEHLRHILIKKEKFTRGAVDDFIRQFRATIEFAKLEESDNLLGHEEDKRVPEKEIPMPEQITVPQRERSHVPPASLVDPRTGIISFPLSAKKWVRVELPYELSEKEWKRIIETLDVFKPGFIKETTELDEEDE